MTKNRTSICTKTRHPGDFLMYIAIYACAAVSVALLLGIIIYVFVKGIRSVNWEFLTSVTSVLNGTTGIAGNILNTLYIIVLTMLMATPVGVGAAVYLNEYAKPGKLVSLIEFATETLAGIPSIIFGSFGKLFFGETLGFSFSILTGAFTMALMVLPLVTRNTQEALKTVPDSYRTGAIGLGAGKWHMIRTILLPSAMPGIITGVILAVKNRGESCRTAFHRRKCRASSKEFYTVYGKDRTSGWNPYHSVIFERNKGRVRRSLWYCGSTSYHCAGHQFPHEGTGKEVRRRTQIDEICYCPHIGVISDYNFSKKLANEISLAFLMCYD